MSVSSAKTDNKVFPGQDAASDKVVVVTGASSGLGFEAAKQLAGAGAETVLICRDAVRGERARSNVADIATQARPVLMLADLSVQADVRRVAREITDRYDAVDVLINNAGSAFDTRKQSADGLELTWATNHLAPFLLTDLLLPALLAAPGGRVVNVTSEIYSRKLDLANLQGEREFRYFGAYRISKLGNVLFTAELARRVSGSGATVVSVSPGPARTNFGGGGPSGIMGAVTGVLKRTPVFKSAERAAEGIIWVATAPESELIPGALYMRRKQLKLKGAARDPKLAAKLWQISAEQVGLDPARRSVATGTSESTSND